MKTQYVEGMKLVSKIHDFFKANGIKIKRGKYATSIYESNHVACALTQIEARNLIQKLNATLVEGFGTSGKSHFAWSNYHVEVEGLGKVQITIDRRNLPAVFRVMPNDDMTTFEVAL